MTEARSHHQSTFIEESLLNLRSSLSLVSSSRKRRITLYYWYCMSYSSKRSLVWSAGQLIGQPVNATSRQTSQNTHTVKIVRYS